MDIFNNSIYHYYFFLFDDIYFFHEIMKRFVASAVVNIPNHDLIKLKSKNFP